MYLALQMIIILLGVIQLWAILKTRRNVNLHGHYLVAIVEFLQKKFHTSNRQSPWAPFVNAKRKRKGK
jgi:hypothetical protein